KMGRLPHPHSAILGLRHLRAGAFGYYTRARPFHQRADNIVAFEALAQALDDEILQGLYNIARCTASLSTVRPQTRAVGRRGLSGTPAGGVSDAVSSS